MSVDIPAPKTKITVGVPFAAALALGLILAPHGKLPLALACAAVHECGHILCLYALGGAPRRIVLMPFGMRMERGEDMAISVKGEILIALAGPAFSFLLAGLLYLLHCKQGALISLGLGIFNLLPVGSLDGGRSLQLTLSLFLPEQRVQKMMDFSSLFCLLLCFGVVIFMLCQGQMPWGLLPVTIYLLLLLCKRIR